MNICIYTKAELLEEFNDFFHWNIPEDYIESAKKVKGFWTTTRRDESQIEVHINYEQYVMLIDNE